MRKILPILAIAALVIAGIALYSGIGRQPAPPAESETAAASAPAAAPPAAAPAAASQGETSQGETAQADASQASSSKADASKVEASPAAATGDSTVTTQTQTAAGEALPETAPAGLLVTPEDNVLGDPKAPVTIIEYASLTCPHCAHFHAETYPKLKKDYIDTGKARFVYRDFPLDGLALRAAMLAHCAGKDRYYGFLDLLFDNQDSWAHVDDPMAALARTVKVGGMDQASFDKCVNDEALSKEVAKSRFDAEKVLDIESTPTFFINGEKVSGARPYADFQAVLNRQLAALNH